jgi:hypothetical protein
MSLLEILYYTKTSHRSRAITVLKGQEVELKNSLPVIPAVDADTADLYLMLDSDKPYVVVTEA